MKRLLLIALFLSSVSFAQRPGTAGRTARGNFGGSTYGSSSGFGNVLFPGTGHPPGVNPNPRRLGGPAGSRVDNNRFPGLIGYPVYVGGYYGGYNTGYGDYFNGFPQAPQEPNVTVVNAPPAQPAQPIVINQYFNSLPPQASQPSDDQALRIYQHQTEPAQAAAASAASEPRTYLIAYKDHSVYSAIAYWVEGHTLHYVTGQNTHNQSDLSLIDMEFTKKLNGDALIKND